jgi:hypothetical protein
MFRCLCPSIDLKQPILFLRQGKKEEKNGLAFLEFLKLCCSSSLVLGALYLNLKN